MELSQAVKDVLNSKTKINILSTGNREGKVNTAIFGSALLTENNTISFVLKSTSRSLANIKEHPYASCLILLPEAGGSGLKIKGCRIYLKKELLELSRNPVYLVERPEGEAVGWEKSFNVDREKKAEERSTPDSYLVVFSIVEARPIVDTGQGI